MKKIPMRMCVVTKERHPKQDLIRLVVVDEKLTIDPTGKVNGKGCYLKKDKEIIQKPKCKKNISRALKVEVPDEIITELLNMI